MDTVLNKLDDVQEREDLARQKRLANVLDKLNKVKNINLKQIN
jgi:hypothetical protein